MKRYKFQSYLPNQLLKFYLLHKTKLFLLYGLWIISITNAFAANNACVIHAQGGLLDKFIGDFASIAVSLGAKSDQYAHWIFWLLFAFEFMWQLVIKKVFAGDIEKLWLFFFTRMILGMFFAKYIINLELYKGIISFFATFGSELAKINFKITDGGASLFHGLTPSMIISYFSCVADAVHAVTDGSGVISYITLKVFFAIMLIIVFMLLLVLAFVLIKVLFQTYILLYAGFILVGFAGSSWTMNYWQRYLQAISAMAIKFMIITVLMGFIQAESVNWMTQISNARGSIQGLAGALISILGETTIFTLIAYQLPEWAGTVLAGEVRIRLNDQMTGVSGFMSGNGER